MDILPQQPRCWHLFHIAHPTQQLYTIQRTPPRAFSRIKNSPSTILRPNLPRFIYAPRRIIRVRPRCAKFRIHVCKLALHKLIVCNGDSKLLALMRERERSIHGGLHDAEWASTENESFDIEPF